MGLPPLLETLLPSKSCLSASLNNSLPCLGAKVSCIGILERVWMRWNSLKQNLTWTIWYLNINNTKKQQLRMRVNSMKRKKKKWLKKTKVIYSLSFNHKYPNIYVYPSSFLYLLEINTKYCHLSKITNLKHLPLHRLNV